mmetsp:Transcript_92166/g.256797  ORF Transcript_92166/g.256797 Transcript_92166/m.256797 type:complete len:100 (-) Transcript_92166:51-350(-)
MAQALRLVAVMLAALLLPPGVSAGLEPPPRKPRGERLPDQNNDNCNFKTGEGCARRTASIIEKWRTKSPDEIKSKIAELRESGKTPKLLGVLERLHAEL